MDALILFSSMTDEDFIEVHRVGQLNNLCVALSVDLQMIQNQTPHQNKC